MIVVTERDRENKKLLVIENINKIVMTEVTIMLSAIDLGNKHSWVINNADINVVEDWGLIDIKKY